jgi:hypothetical protein
MAVDTIEKRISMLNFASGGGTLLPYPPAIAEVSQEDRLTFLDLYGGPPPAELVVPVGVVMFSYRRRRVG